MRPYVVYPTKVGQLGRRTHDNWLPGINRRQAMPDGVVEQVERKFFLEIYCIACARDGFTDDPIFRQPLVQRRDESRKSLFIPGGDDLL